MEGDEEEDGEEAEEEGFEAAIENDRLPDQHRVSIFPLRDFLITLSILGERSASSPEAWSVKSRGEPQKFIGPSTGLGHCGGDLLHGDLTLLVLKECGWSCLRMLPPETCPLRVCCASGACFFSWSYESL